MNEVTTTLNGVLDTILAIRVHRHPRIRIDEVEEAERLVKRLGETENNSPTGASTERTSSIPSTREGIRRSLIKHLEDMKTRVNGQDREALEDSIRKLNDLL
jgi:hypothetical protein